MRKAVYGIFACLLFLAALAPHHAGAAAPSGRVALVVGVSDYPGTLRLPNPTNDANNISDALKELNFKVITVLDPNRTEFVDALSRFYEITTGAEVALFYYSGHGLQVQGVNYLLPKDVRLDNAWTVTHEAITLQSILDTMKARAAIKLTFLDACRDNSSADDLQRSIGKLDRSASPPRGLAPMRIADGELNTALIFAALPGKTAADGQGRNSPFTAAILKNIRTPGSTLDDLLNNVTSDVSEATNGEQIPERLSRMKTKFVFNPAVTAAGSAHGKTGLAPSAPAARAAPADSCKTANPALECFLRKRQ